ncbi:MAG: 2-oxoglutarate dehydrogenase, E2 component, dihydrolipoamide succinyltransferase [Mycobacteriales bacterium]
MAEVTMPRLGVSVTEGTLLTWFKAVGDSVEVGEPICEVGTDKVDTEIESTATGVLTEQRFAEGDTVPVGASVAVVAAPGGTEPAVQRSEGPAGGEAPVPPPEVDAVEPAGARSAVGDGGHVLMPRLGVSVTEGVVTTWLKAVGDRVALGEPICEVATDKVDTEIESTVAGILAAQRYAEGETVLVGEPLAVVTPDGAPFTAAPLLTLPGHPAAGAPVASRPAPVPQRPSGLGTPAVLRPGPFDHAAAVALLHAGIPRSGRPGASPAARRLAAELGVDLADLAGSGGGGHVTRADVQRRATDWPESPHPPTASPSAAVPRAAQRSTGPSTTAGALPAGYEDVPFEEVPTSRIRRLTAEHMSRSRRTAAHMTTEVDVDLGRLSELRSALNARRLTNGLPKLSFLPFVARATCSALLEHRDLNATFETERLLRWGEVNLGIAVDTPRGLMVPVIRSAERLTLESLAASIVAAADRVRSGRMEADDFRAGTFTLSNPGSVGAVSAPAIINQPQVAILGMPTIVRRPWVVRLSDGQETIGIRPIIRLALTFDHRAVDGAAATRFLADVGRRLESWEVGDSR